jgi:hypothetical protein
VRCVFGLQERRRRLIVAHLNTPRQKDDRGQKD